MRPPTLIPERSLKLTRRPSAFGVAISTLVMQYGATFFRDAFARFIAGWHNPDLTRAQLEHESMNVIIPFTAVSVYHCLKFTNIGKTETEDSLHVYPLRRKKNGRTDDARFDTALVRIGAIGETGIQAFRVAQSPPSTIPCIRRMVYMLSTGTRMQYRDVQGHTLVHRHITTIRGYSGQQYSAKHTPIPPPWACDTTRMEEQYSLGTL
ncbi:hypothetical protein JOM56_010393 [Amanita muscaria]